MEKLSSMRFKENIKDIGHESTHLWELRPVSFTYINDTSYSKQYGLVAEEVAQTALKDLVFFDDKGSPLGVKYHELPPLLLSELQKQTKIINQMQKIITHLNERIESVEEYLKSLQTV